MQPVAIIVLLIAGLTQAIPASGMECRMAKDFDQPSRDSRGEKSAVWRDTTDGTLLFVGGLHVNTDGTKRSYSVDDFWGETKALNNLCNAMSDACAGLNIQGLRARRIKTQEASVHGWPASELKASRIASSIIPFQNGKPCPTADGFLVSATALKDPGKTDVCEIGRYVDALNVPALVLPLSAKKRKPTGFDRNGANTGDLLVAMVPGRLSSLTYAVVGDKGPSNALGEGSIALNGKLN